MKLIGIVGALLFASAVLAAPFSEQRQAGGLQEMANLVVGQRGVAILPAANYSILQDDVFVGGNKDVQYSADWAGVSLTSTGVTQVVGNIVAPAVSMPAGGESSTSYQGAAWVGIDGYPCNSSILQTVIQWTIQNGQTSYAAWYEWYPDLPYTFNLTIKAGDPVEMKVVADTSTSGTVYTTNLSTGENASHAFTDGVALCGASAEWIVEDSPVVYPETATFPFAQFSDITFTGASFTHGGQTSGVDGAGTWAIVAPSQKMMTDCGVSDSSTVYCKYIG